MIATITHAEELELKDLGWSDTYSVAITDGDTTLGMVTVARPHRGGVSYNVTGEGDFLDNPEWDMILMNGAMRAVAAHLKGGEIGDPVPFHTGG